MDIRLREASESAECTAQLIDFALTISFDRVPTDVVDQAKLMILDAIGCALGGTNSDLGKRVTSAFPPQTEAGHLIIGSTSRRPGPIAAFVNATLTNALDFDDDNGVGHPSASILPAMIVEAETAQISGRRFVEAMIAAQEVSVRVGRATWPTAKQYENVWGVGTHQVFGAVVGAGLVSGFSHDALANAFGIAGTSAPVPSAMKWGWDKGPISWMKDAVAWPAMTATTSVALAKSGFEGCQDFLDGPHGFWIMAASDRFDTHAITGGLGQDFSMLGTAFKPYPCCRYAHPTLDAIGAITKGAKFTSDQIAKVEISSLSDLKRYMERPRPLSLVEAQFSMPFLAALVIRDGGLNPDALINDSILSEQSVHEISDKIHIVADPKADQKYNETQIELRSNVAITFCDGSVKSASVQFPRGGPQNPIPLSDLYHKFDAMAEPVIGPSARDLRDRILNMDEASSLRNIFDSLRPKFY